MTLNPSPCPSHSCSDTPSCSDSPLNHTLQDFESWPDDEHGELVAQWHTVYAGGEGVQNKPAEGAEEKSRAKKEKKSRAKKEKKSRSKKEKKSRAKKEASH